MITNLRKNCLGTVTFDGLFPGMRKSQDFDVYPVKAGETPASLTVQSDTRMGLIKLDTGEVMMSTPKPGGYANFAHLRATGKVIGTVPPDELAALKERVAATAGAHVGTSFVKVDNSGAAGVLS